MGEFKRVGENLVRHRAGTYYLRAKVGGKCIRESLETKILSLAKKKRNTRLKALRRAAISPVKVRTVGDALAVARSRQVEGAHLKQSTRNYYKQIYDYLESSLPVSASGKSWREADGRDWWQKTVQRFSSPRANASLAACRRVAGIMMDSGAMLDDPTRLLRPVSTPETPLEIPTREQMDQIIDSIRKQNRRESEHSANMVGFIAFSGLRIAEARALQWEEIKSEVVVVTGGDTSTKNKRVRRVPISPALRTFIDRLRYDGCAGKVFHMHSPRFALERACKRLGLPHLTPHGLRHFFCTWTLNRGVPVATVAGWIGHSDGGALLLKRYSHLLDQHSLDAAKKLF